MGSPWVSSWSKTQSSIVLSPAEFELYVAAKAAAVSLGIRPMAQDPGTSLHIRGMAGAPAALGTIARKGFGKVRHLDANHLWAQEIAAKRVATFQEIRGNENSADLMAKEVSEKNIEKHIGIICAKSNIGRAEFAAKLHENSVSCRVGVGEKKDICHRPRQALLVAQGPVITKPAGRPGKNDPDNEEVKHFELRKQKGRIKMVIGGIAIARTCSDHYEE